MANNMPPVQEAAFNKQRAYIQGQFNGVTYMPNNMDVQHEPLWDTVTFAAAAPIPNDTPFFVNVAGKTLAQTNMLESRKLQAPEAFAVKGIGFRFIENILLADAIAIANPETGYALDFWIGQKSYNRAPIPFYNNGGGITGVTTQTDQSAFTNGRTGKDNRHILAINIIIDNQASFYAKLAGAVAPYTLTASASGGTGATMQVILDGFHARGVQ